MGEAVPHAPPVEVVEDALVEVADDESSLRFVVEEELDK